MQGFLWVRCIKYGGQEATLAQSIIHQKIIKKCVDLFADYLKIYMLIIFVGNEMTF